MRDRRNDPSVARLTLREILPQWTATAYVGLVSLAVSVAIGRAFGPADFGEYGMAMAAGSILAIFIDGGLSNLLRRETTRPSTNLEHLAGRLPAISLGHAVTVAGVGALLAVSFVQGHLPLALATVCCFLGTVLVGYVSAMLRGRGRWAAEAGWQASQRTLSASMILVALVIGVASPWQVISVWAAASMIAVLMFPSPMRCRPELSLKFEVYKVTAPLVLIEMATAIYFRSDILVLGWFDFPRQELGQYAAAYRLFEAVIIAAGPVGLLLFRRMRLFQGAPEAFRRSLIMSVAAAAAIGISVAVVAYAAADSLVGWSYGERYPDASGLLRVICWGLVFMLPNLVLTQAALALELDRTYLWAATLAALINLAANFALVPQFGTVAAACTTVVTEGVLCTYLALTLLRQRSLVPSREGNP